MPEYSEQDLKYAAEFRDEIHKEALAKARALYPEIDTVTDPHPVEDYFQEHWDYPGKQYTVIAIPYGYNGRQALVDKIAENTVKSYLRQRDGGTEDSFYEVIARYPDAVVDYAIVGAEGPYSEAESHWNALLKGASRIFGNQWELSFDIGKISSRKITPDTLFAPADKKGGLNYRKAFLQPPHGNSYTDKDFDTVNTALFPNGTEGLEIFEWSTEWSDYFDDGHEWWGTLCITVYDKSLERFAVIMASATD